MMTVAGARYRQQFGGHFPAHCQRSPATPITPVIHRFAFLLQSYRLFWCQCGMSSKVRDREAANPGWPDVDYAPLMDEAFHARGRTYGVSVYGFHPPIRCQMYPIDQRVGLQDETLKPVKEEKQFNKRSLT